MRRACVVLCVVLVGALLMGVGGCSGDEEATTTASSATTLAPTTTVAPSTTASTAPTTSSSTATTEPDAPTTTESEAADGDWQKAFELSGSGTEEKTSELFELSGAPARISYTVAADTVWTMGAFVEPEGWDIKTQGGFPDIWESEKTEGSETLEQEAGSHFLYVTAANCDWTVVIEEQK